MQYKNGILAIAVLMGVFSCTHREDDGIQKVKFQAIQADGPSTKTVLQADGSVFWSPGDGVSLFYGGATIQKTQLTAENTSAAAQTIFSGVLDGFLPDGSTDFWAVYPYSADTDFDGTAVTVTVPAEQTAVEGTFSSDAFVSIATSKDYTLQFYNLCGGIKFSVANQGIQSVIFSGNNDEILAGQVQATFDENGKPVVTEVVKGTMELVLNGPDGGFEVGKWYYLVALPTTLSTGYTMTFLDATGEVVAERVTDTAISIKRAVWGKLTEADNVEEPISASKYLTFTSEGTTKITLYNGPGNAPVLYYSDDTENWKQWDYDTLYVTANKPLYLCGSNPEGLSTSMDLYSQFKTKGDDFAVSGSVMSLLNKDTDITVIPSAFCFYNLFDGCVQMTSAPSLPATTLAKGCYMGMFSYCYKLTEAPVLASTSLADYCYEKMFLACYGLTSAPELPATTLATSCYKEMFSYCTGLTSAPELPAMTMADTCYEDMFSNCTHLIAAPDLPATVLARACYGGMFYNCSGLTKAPDKLPALTLAEECYNSMFNLCTSLTKGPELPAPTLVKGCYGGMFENCHTNFNYIKCLATDISADDCLGNWVFDVAESGTFVKAANVQWPRGASGIPEGWTVENATQNPNSGENEGYEFENW